MFIWEYSNYSQISDEARNHFVFKNPRPGQLETVTEIKEAIDRGYRYIILEAGTGTGKSAVAATLTSMFDTSYVLTVTKQLQNQYVRDFPTFSLVKGRSNFTCRKYAEEGFEATCDVGKCITEGYSCEYHIKNRPPSENTCPYHCQKYKAMQSDVVVSNYPYMFFELNYVRDFSERNILICDEAHNLESTIMNQLKLEFSLDDLRQYIKMDLDDETVSNLINGGFTEWIEFIEKVQMKYSQELEKITGITGKPGLSEKISFMKNTITDCTRFISDIRKDPEIWICDFNEEFESVRFTPLKIDSYARSTLLDYADACIFMSATILDYRIFANWLGIAESEVYAIRQKSPFDIKRNPIKTHDRYSLSRSLIRVNAPKTVDIIKIILEKHRNEKGIIHTVSGQCRDFIMKSVNSPRLIDHNVKNRSEQLQRYIESGEPLVLVSPSMNEGVDLPGDLCRFQIIYKMPYPDLGDRQVSLRNNIDNLWYDYRTCLSIVQTHGRGMRYDGDYCTTYFIDSRFRGYVRRDANVNNFLPDSFRKAIDAMPADIEKESDDYFADENYKDKIDRKYRLLTRANQFLEDENYEGAIRFYTSLLNHELFINDYHPYLKLARAYHGAELYERELETLIGFFRSGRYCPASKLRWFRERLEDLSAMGYFDESQIPDLEREYKNSGALNRVLSHQPVPTAHKIRKDFEIKKPKLRIPPEHFDDVCRMQKNMTHDEKVAFKYRLYLYGKNLINENEYDMALSFYIRILHHELFANDYYPFKKIAVVLRKKRKYREEADAISVFLKSDRYCDSSEYSWFVNRLEELAYHGDFDPSKIEDLKSFFLKNGAMRKSRANTPVPMVKRLKKLSHTRHSHHRSDDYLRDYYSSLK